MTVEGEGARSGGAGTVCVITPVIDLIELKSGRGNAFLSSAVPLAKSLHADVSSLGMRLEAIAITQERLQSVPSASTATRQIHHESLQKVLADIKDVLNRIDREVPLLQLAITASGESLSTSIPPGVSPSRLLQASTLLIVGDTHHAQNPWSSVQIGPAFGLTLYMLFQGHATSSTSWSTLPKRSVAGTCPTLHEPMVTSSPYGLGEGQRKPLWQEVLHKARVRLCRNADPTPAKSSAHGAERSENITAQQYSYFLEIVEDLDDGRVHSPHENFGAFNGIENAGIREAVPISQFSKMFYTDTGKILNIGGDPPNNNRPVLLLKRDIRTMSQSAEDAIEMNTCRSFHGAVDDEQSDIDRQLSEDCSVKHGGKGIGHSVDFGKSSLPGFLDPEWLAFEVHECGAEEIGDSDEEANPDSDDGTLLGQAEMDLRQPSPAVDDDMVAQLRNLSLHQEGAPAVFSVKEDGFTKQEAHEFVARSPFAAVTTSLSLLEMLIRLAGLQEFQQASHLTIPDHVLTFFLEETSTTGLVGEDRRRARNDAQQRVGFDPYIDSP
ncbi:binding protein [Paramyrothecium foliicola]|nr:binding protein [Paramyrothecium foliicola]